MGFNLITGSGKNWFDDVDFGSAGGGAGLIGPEVTQADCPSGSCGPKIPLTPNLPCDPNEGTGGSTIRSVIPIAWSEIVGFTPIE